MQYTIEHVQISTIKAGDTVMHRGVLKTVCRNNLGMDSFMGITLFGDCYKMGRKLVQRVNIHRSMPEMA